MIKVYSNMSGVTHEGTGIATAEALLWSLPHNGTRLYGTTIEYIVTCTSYHTGINAKHNSMNSSCLGIHPCNVLLISN